MFGYPVIFDIRPHCVKTIQPLYLTSHLPYLYLCGHTHCINDITHIICRSSHILYVWNNMHYIQHHTHALWHHNPLFMTSKLLYLTSETLYDSTPTVSVSSHPDYWSYNPHCMYDITAKICISSYELHMTSHPLFMISHHSMTSHPLYSCYHTQIVWHHIQCSCAITHTVWLEPHLLYVWHQTHYMYDIIWILYDITPTLYHIKRLHSWYHIHSIHDITPTLFDITTTESVLSHPFYWWHHIMYGCHHSWHTCDIIQTLHDITCPAYDITTLCDITTAVFMSSRPVYLTSHQLKLLLYLQCIVYTTPTLTVTSIPLYVWLIWILYDVTSTLYDFTRLCSWHHTHSIHDITPTVSDITSTLLMTSQPLYLRQDTDFVYDITLSTYDISHGVWMTTQPLPLTSHPLYLCNHTHLNDNIIPCVSMKSYPLHVWHQRHCIWHHIHCGWHKTIVFMSWHPLYLWYHIPIYDVTHTVCMTTPALYLTWNPFYLPSYPLYISWHPLCQRHHSNYVRSHRWHMNAIICTIHDIISTLYDNNP